ncbi:MAG: hypothetical protein U0746_21275 [Gemmataceae bacterium]
MIELRGHTRPVVGLAYAPDGRTLASASHDGTARLWNVSTGTEIGRFRSVADRATCLGFNAAGTELAIGYAHPHGLVQRLHWPAATLCESWAAHGRMVRALAYHPAAPALATAGDGDFVKLWAINQKYPGYRPLGPRGGFAVDGLAFAPDGGLLAAMTSGPATLRLLHPERRRIQKSYQFAITWGYCVAFAPSGERVACGLEGDVGEWDVKPKKMPPARWRAHAGAVLGVAYLPDGSGLLTTGADGLVKSWDLAGNLRCSFDWQIGELCSLAIAPDGLTAAAGGAESIVVWDLE